MSYGLMCLTCRRYIQGDLPPHKDFCKCENPLPSEDGKTPRDCREEAPHPMTQDP